MRIFLLIAMSVWAMSALAGDDRPPRWKGWCDYEYPVNEASPPRLNLPAWVCVAAYEGKLHERYEPYTKINPFFLSGDFDSDGKTDIAIWVVNKRNQKRGVLFLHQGDKRRTVIGAGTNYDKRGDDYDGLDVWSLVPKGEILDTIWMNNRKVLLRGDAIVVGKSESASVVIYWDGKKYAFYQESD